VAQSSRRRRKRRPDYRPPPRRRTAQGEAERSDEDARASRTAPSRPGRRRPTEERPAAPWGRFPLVELVVLIALVILIIGFFVQGSKGVTLIATGITLGSLAGLELSIREHFAGYRSHSAVLAGAPTVIVLGAGFFLIGWAPAVGLGAALLVFAVCFYLLREAFKRRSGGLGFR
jgi:hypothetical protein